MLTIHPSVCCIPYSKLSSPDNQSHPLFHWGDELIATRPKISKRHSVHHSVSDCTNTFLALGVVVFVVCSICCVCCFGSGRLSVGLFLCHRNEIAFKRKLLHSTPGNDLGMLSACLGYLGYSHSELYL